MKEGRPIDIVYHRFEMAAKISGSMIVIGMLCFPIVTSIDLPMWFLRILGAVFGCAVFLFPCVALIGAFIDSER